MGSAAPWDFPVTIYLYICVFIRGIALLLVELCLFSIISLAGPGATVFSGIPAIHIMFVMPTDQEIKEKLREKETWVRTRKKSHKQGNSLGHCTNILILLCCYIRKLTKKFFEVSQPQKP